MANDPICASSDENRAVSTSRIATVLASVLDASSLERMMRTVDRGEHFQSAPSSFCSTLSVPSPSTTCRASAHSTIDPADLCKAHRQCALTVPTLLPRTFGYFSVQPRAQPPSSPTDGDDLRTVSMADHIRDSLCDDRQLDSQNFFPVRRAALDDLLRKVR